MMTDVTVCAAPSLRSRRQRGFTLIEMLVVLMIAGLLLAFVTLVPSSNRRSALSEDAQRLAAMLESASDEAQIRSASIAWQPDRGGYRFYQRGANGAWLPLADDMLGPQRWGAAVSAVSIRYAGSGETIPRVILADESIDLPVTVTLRSGNLEVQVIGTGIGSFEVKQP